MKKGFQFSYWLGKVVTLLGFLAPMVFQILPTGWENITMGVAIHGALDYMNQKYHQ